jgi:hypothetical protein
VSFECCTVTLTRSGERETWRALVTTSDQEQGTLVGVNLVLGHYSALGWELVSMLPLSWEPPARPASTLEVRTQRLVMTAMLAVFKRPYDLQADLANLQRTQGPLAFHARR